STRSRNYRDRTQRTLEISSSASPVSPASPVHHAVRAAGRSTDHPWVVIIESGSSIIGPCYRTALREARCCSHATASSSDREPLLDLARTSRLVQVVHTRCHCLLDASNARHQCPMLMSAARSHVGTGVASPQYPTTTTDVEC
ncbi:hypothetical protein ACLOJK_026845, partial [Asimina triloba]